MLNLLYLESWHLALVESGDSCTYWDSRVFQEDMRDMWINPDVLKEWTKSGERRGRVRFSQDEEKRPYLSRVEVKVRKIIYVCKFYSIFSVTWMLVPDISCTCQIAIEVLWHGPCCSCLVQEFGTHRLMSDQKLAVKTWSFFRGAFLISGVLHSRPLCHSRENNALFPERWSWGCCSYL